MHEKLRKLRQNHQKNDAHGIVSVCSTHALVLKTAMEEVRQTNQPLLIETTASQVNQYGGYTGRTPKQFSAFVNQMAEETGLLKNQFMIGADHLGPHVWKNGPGEIAMQKAEELIRQCVLAGFGKIHLDTGVGCADDPEVPPLPLIAKRAARLCHVAEAASLGKKNSGRLLYVIGNEVPIPGGGLETDQGVLITDPDHMVYALDQYKDAFYERDLDEAFDRVIAMVVQPGADFGDEQVSVYQPEKAKVLSNAYSSLPGIMTYEIHSTDYQPPQALKQMVRDHFNLLKVGPCLTFALRKALYALARVEADLPGIPFPSNLIRVMEEVMTAQPVYWLNHYQGTAEKLKYLRHHSLRDRIRYYWPFPQARAAVDRLFKNLQRPLPLSLLARHLPELYPDIERNRLNGEPEAMVKFAIGNELKPYRDAVGFFSLR